MAPRGEARAQGVDPPAVEDRLAIVGHVAVPQHFAGQGDIQALGQVAPFDTAAQDQADQAQDLGHALAVAALGGGVAQPGKADRRLDQAQLLQMQIRAGHEHGQECGAGIAALVRGRLHPFEQRLVVGDDHLVEEVRLVGEAGEHRARRQFRRSGDVADRGGLIAALGDQAAGGVQELQARAVLGLGTARHRRGDGAVEAAGQLVHSIVQLGRRLGRSGADACLSLNRFIQHVAPLSRRLTVRDNMGNFPIHSRTIARGRRK